MALEQNREQNRAGQSPRRRIRLLSGFEVDGAGGRLQFPLAACRLIAYLALQERPVSRSVVAGVLWPENSQERAQGSLRSTLWRARRIDETIIESHGECLTLGADILVDVAVIVEAIRALDNGGEPPDQIPVTHLSAEILPDWYDDWVLFERERFRLLALHALEQLAGWYTARRNLSTAFDCALAAIRLEPLRESAHRSLMIVHIAEGNAYEAVNHYRFYRRLLRQELGIEPSDLMLELLGSVGYSDQAEAG